MKPPRHNCQTCVNFIYPELTKHGMIKTNAKCSTGKRVAFHMPIKAKDWFNEMGWFRYCDEFKEI